MINGSICGFSAVGRRSLSRLLRNLLSFFLALFLFAEINCFAADIQIDGEATNKEWGAADSLAFYPSEDSGVSVDTLFVKIFTDKAEKIVYLRISAHDGSGKEPKLYLRINSVDVNVSSNLNYNDFSVEYARVEASLDKSYADAELAVRFSSRIESSSISVAFIDGNGAWSSYYSILKEKTDAQTEPEKPSETKIEAKKSSSDYETQALTEKTANSTKKNDTAAQSSSREAASDDDTVQNPNRQGYANNTKNTDNIGEKADKDKDENEDKAASDKPAADKDEDASAPSKEEGRIGKELSKSSHKKTAGIIGGCFLLAGISAFIAEKSARNGEKLSQKNPTEAENEAETEETKTE